MTEKEKKRQYRVRRRNDPVRHAKDLEKRKEKRRLKRLAVLEKRKKSPYWQRQGYDRYYRHSPFKRLARQSNGRCKRNKITAFELWCLAKKQKLICALTGEKLTYTNLSVDHKIPISKGGTNNLSNLQLVTFHANTAKNSMTNEEFYLFCQRVINRLTHTTAGGTNPA